MTALAHDGTGLTDTGQACSSHPQRASAMSVLGGRRAGLAVPPETTATRVALRGPCTLDSEHVSVQVAPWLRGVTPGSWDSRK